MTCPPALARPGGRRRRAPGRPSARGRGDAAPRRARSRALGARPRSPPRARSRRASAPLRPGRGAGVGLPRAARTPRPRTPGDPGGRPLPAPSPRSRSRVCRCRRGRSSSPSRRGRAGGEARERRPPEARGPARPRPRHRRVGRGARARDLAPGVPRAPLGRALRPRDRVPDSRGRQRALGAGPPREPAAHRSGGAPRGARPRRRRDPSRRPFRRSRCRSSPGNPLGSPLLAEGHFTVQDVGAQALALLLPPGDLLVDLAAAPGGKSFAALALGRAKRTVSLDRSPARLRRFAGERAAPRNVRGARGRRRFPRAAASGRPIRPRSSRRPVQRNRHSPQDPGDPLSAEPRRHLEARRIAGRGGSPRPPSCSLRAVTSSTRRAAWKRRRTKRSSRRSSPRGPSSRRRRSTRPPRSAPSWTAPASVFSRTRGPTVSLRI